MTNTYQDGLEKLKERAFVLGVAHQCARERFTYSNVFTLVLPAVLSTAVAVMAAIPKASEEWILFESIPVTSVFAGLAAILVTIHKVLNCEEYQAECLRLSNIFKSIAQEAEISAYRSNDHDIELTRLSEKLSLAIENAKATVPKKCITSAKNRCDAEYNA